MAARVAEDLVRVRRLGPKALVRVDLHGLSVTGAAGDRSFTRWEWIEEITVAKGVVVRSDRGEIHVPAGCFGIPPDELARRLREARAIERRSEMIESLNQR